MLDTVPNGVVLTEVIEPLPVQPKGVALTFMGDGLFLLRGEVRGASFPRVKFLQTHRTHMLDTH